MRGIQSFFNRKRQGEVLDAAKAGKPIPPRPKAMPLAEGTSSPINARLLEACISRDVGTVREALEQGADANVRSGIGHTVLRVVRDDISSIEQWVIMYDVKKYKSNYDMREEESRKRQLRNLREIQELLRKHGAVE